MTGTLKITGDAASDELLNTDGTALLIGMLLDQQVPMEVAFRGPATLRDRLGHLDAAKIAAMSEDEVVAVCCAKPAIHRFPAVMGRRVHGLCLALADEYGGRGEAVWDGVASGEELYERLRALPGFGDEKAKIFVALLGKRFGVRPDRWRETAGKFGDDTPRSAADATTPESLAKIREWKRSQKSAKLDKQDRPLPG
ncbi:MAG: HhH-GPD-type base excision DNA repair protein [Acidimicrobiales bacterium]